MLRAWRGRASYKGDAPLLHWLMRIATNACLTWLAKPRHARSLPELEAEPIQVHMPIEKRESGQWITPAPDAVLFPSAVEALEMRESVAIAFIALLQRLPPRQRAALLLKDVMGWSAEEVSTALDMTVASVNSALRRARHAFASSSPTAADEPPPEVVREYVRSWEERDVDALVALLRKDVVFAMPPYATWYRGASTVRRFVQTPPMTAFWSRSPRVIVTRANCLPALIFLVKEPGAGHRAHSIQLVRFVRRRVVEVVTFIGADYVRGFEA